MKKFALGVAMFGVLIWSAGSLAIAKSPACIENCVDVQVACFAQCSNDYNYHWEIQACEDECDQDFWACFRGC